MSDLKNMLTRMYNLDMHTGLPVIGVPYSWVMFWSRTLEADLSEARLRQLVRKGRGSR